jgi:hypothetical protein
MNTKITLGVSLAALLFATACKRNNDVVAPNQDITFANKSVTPVLMKPLTGVTGVELFSLIGSDDDLPASPGYIFGGSADGLGMLKVNDTTYSIVVNHEDNFAVSRLMLNKNLTVTSGQYILNSNGGIWRLCSATLATPAEHGFGPLFLTCGESGEESRTHAINPLETNFTASQSKEVPGLGRWNAENALPLHKDAFPGKTVILIGDDDSGVEGGQVVLYVADRVGDLQNGKVYVLKRPNNNISERDMVTGIQYDVEFVEIANAASLTGRQIQLASAAANSVRFGRVEDLDYRKGNTAGAKQEVYFTVTGQNNTGTNAAYTRTKYGRVYKLNLNSSDVTKGKLEVILDGDDRSGIARAFQNPDNICVTENYVYVQEDPNGYGDETHDAYIYQYNIATKAMRPVFELDHRRTASDAAKYNVGGSSRFGSWEYGAMVDISETIGVPNTFVLCIQPHTWTGARYRGVDGGTIRPNEQQGSQLVIIKGLEK